MLCWNTDAREKFFDGAAAAGLSVPDFPYTFFGWRFLSRMGSCIKGYGSSLSGTHAASD